jgi:hypothetical protein
VQNLALFVFPDFKDYRIQPTAHPSDGQKLLGNVGPAIKPIGPGKQLARLLETYTAPGICPEAFTLPRIEAEAHRYDCYTTLNR